MENFIELEKSIVDMLKEAQVKIGFSKEEIRLFYQLSSLNNILGTKYGAEEMKGLLNDFVRYSKDRPEANGKTYHQGRTGGYCKAPWLYNGRNKKSVFKKIR